jgi:hypothetical protein
VDQHGVTQSPAAVFPCPPEYQGGHHGQGHQWSAVAHCVQTAEDNAGEQVGHTQRPYLHVYSPSNPALQTQAKHGFFNQRCQKQQDQQSCGLAFCTGKPDIELDCHPGTQRPKTDNQRIRRELTAGVGWGKKWLHDVRMIAVAFSLLAMAPAFAGLGEAESSINADSMRMHARRTVAMTQQYSVNELQSADGSRVKQYVSPSGIIFAVSWHTLYKPNLSSMLGPSFQNYAQAAQQAARRPGIQRHFRHESLDLVVQATSHLNVFSGFAFRQSMLPRGLNLSNLGME